MHVNYRTLLFITLVTAVLATAAGHAQQPQVPAAAVQAQGPQVPAFVPNEVLVQFREAVSEADREAARAVVGAIQRSAIRGGDGRLERLRTSLPVNAAIVALQVLPQVEFAEPNWIVYRQATSNDPYYTDGSLWGMYGDTTSPANQFGSQAGELWARGYTGSNSVYVGVIDEGIYFSHPDLSPNMWTNPFDPVNGIDDDGNAYVDDIRGWDFINNDSSVYDGSASNTDIDSHGTHVAGTIGARGGNGAGVAGVAWNVTLISGKFLGPDGGSIADAIEAVNYFTDLKTRHGLNIVATSNSWGGGGYSTAMHQAIIKGAKQGILFVAAAGNASSNNDSVANYPSNYATNVAAGSETAASYDAVIAVASLMSNGGMSSFSNFGATTVDIGAPGSAIFSTWPQGGYQSISGTSMATPHVTGAVAMYKAIHTSASAEEIRTAILNQGILTDSLSGKTVTGRRLNVGTLDVPLPVLTINNPSVSEGNSGTKTATFTLSLSASSASAVTVNYATADGTATAASTSTTQSNTSSISIPTTVGSESPYPSSINVASGLGNIIKVKVTLIGFTHTWPRDVDVLLVGPTGQTVILMSDVGSSNDASGLTFTLDDDAASSLPSSGSLSSGTFKPTNIADGEGDDAFASPAPAAPYGSTLAGFKSTSPTGEWRLFVRDDTLQDGGSFSGGWSLLLTTAAAGGDYVTTSGTLTIAAGSTTGTIGVTVNGDTTVEPSETFTVNLSNASGATISDGQGVGTISNDDLIFTDNPLVPGTSVKVAHIQELRNAINNLRADRGLGIFSFTDAALTAQSTPIKAAHIAELRTALAAVYTTAGQSAPSYTDPTLTAGVTVMKRVHITEIRDAVVSAP